MSATDRDSFTTTVLAEIATHVPEKSCCRRALIAGMLLVSPEPDSIITTRLVTARAALAALHAEGMTAHAEPQRVPRRMHYRVNVVREFVDDFSERICCTRNLLRGAFMVGGSLRRPDAPPHLEIRTSNANAVQRLAGACAVVELSVAMSLRRGRPVLLVRTTEGVGTFLSSIGADQGRLAYEEGRVVREVRSDVNRRLNAETANLRRTVSAGVEQTAAITKLGSRIETLSPALREAALLRQSSPEQSLEVLATTAGCSRSAMAGRLRRLRELAALDG